MANIANRNVHPEIVVDGRAIGTEYKPYIIAELSANHNGKIENAFRIIDAACKAGADAIKLQTYRPDTITLDCNSDDFQIHDGLWAGKTLYQLYAEAHMPWEWHRPLFDYAKQCGITIFSTPFDFSAVDLLEELHAPAYKIASFEAIDLPLIKYVAGTGKPMIISTGMADVQEIEEAIAAASDGGCKEIAILHCVSGYPAPSSDYNLRTIADLMQRFGRVTGLSDHTIDLTTALTSIALGSSIIEKHVTLNRQGGGPDDSFSIEPHELQELCRCSKTAWESLGKVSYTRQKSESGNVKYRRSLYFVKSMESGDIIRKECIKSVRPGFGLPPKYWEFCIGKAVKKSVSANTPVLMELLDIQ